MAVQHHTIAADAAQNLKPDKIKIITDEPSFEDALDFNNYSLKLAEIIRNSTPRFSIGIFGGWGTGKTTLMLMTKQILDSDKKIVTVWFDAWRYEREEDLAVLPFLRAVKLTLDASEKVKTGNWNIVKNGVVKTGNVFSAIAKSAKISSGIPGVVSADIDFGKAADTLKGDGSIGNDKNTIYYHVTGFLEKALQELRKQDADRIVIFIDDLDRCNPEKALEYIYELSTIPQ